MARPSLQRIWKNILLVSPNPIALLMQGIITTVRVLPIPGLAKVCDTGSAAITRLMNARADNIRADISRLIASEDAASVKNMEHAKVKATSNAEAAKASQPHAEEKTRQEAAKQVTNVQTDSTKKIIRANTAELEKSIQHNTTNKIIEEQDLGKKERALGNQQHEYRLESNEVAHKTAWIDNTKIHLDAMTDHVNTLAETAEKTSGSAKKNTDTTNKATKEIEGLKSEMALVIEANAKLTSQLHTYDTQETKGNSAKDQATQIQKAMLDIITAESKLKTKIAISSLDGKAALQQTITKDLAAKDQSIDALLAKQSSETITKIHTLTKEQLKSQHKIIELTTEPSQRGACEEHLKHLETLLHRTNEIMGQVVTKTTSNPIPEDMSVNNHENGPSKLP